MLLRWWWWSWSLFTIANKANQYTFIIQTIITRHKPHNLLGGKLSSFDYLDIKKNILFFYWWTWFVHDYINVLCYSNNHKNIIMAPLSLGTILADFLCSILSLNIATVLLIVLIGLLILKIIITNEIIVVNLFFLWLKLLNFIILRKLL